MKMSYPELVKSLIHTLTEKEKDKVLKIAELTQKTVNGGGIIFVFGAGHSSILTEEAFHRAGGLIPVYPILHQFLSPHISPKIAGKMERLDGVASILFNHAKVTSKDMMWIASNSGINAAAIEMALECKKAGAKTVALTSLSHSEKTTTRHSSGKKLYELCDFVLDNHCPQGDALFEIDGVRVAAGSSIANNFLYHWVLTESCKLWSAEGKQLPVYKSANLPGGDEHNEKMEAPFKSRIPLL